MHRLVRRLRRLLGRKWPPLPLTNGNEFFRYIAAEIFAYIGPYLSEADQAAFALSSPWLLCKLGRASLRLNERSRFDLLKRLRRDSCYLTEILCPTCRIFHLPRISQDLSPAEGARACVKFGDRRMLVQTTSPNLPAQVHFDIVAAIVRNHQQIPTHYGTELLQSSSHHQHGMNEARINVHVSAKVALGDLFLKTEKILSVGLERRKSLQIVPQLLDMLHTNQELGDCCEHVKWYMVLPFMFESTGADTSCSKPAPNRSITKQKCPWTHSTRCPYWALSCINSPSRAVLNIWGCRRCCTDYTISMSSSHEGANLLVLTSWKNLGAGKRLDDARWMTHLQHDMGCTSILRECATGGIYKEFEMEKEGHVPSIPYEPRLDWWMLQRLCQQGFSLVVLKVLGLRDTRCRHGWSNCSAAITS